MSDNPIDQNTLDDLTKMVGEDFIGELVETYFEDSHQLLTVLHRALAERDAALFRRAAHTLKSNSASLGASRVAAIAKDLESMGRDSQLDEAKPKLDDLETAYALAAEELKALL